MRIQINPTKTYKVIIVLMIITAFLFPSAKLLQFPLNLIGLIVIIVGIKITLSAKKSLQKRNTSTIIGTIPNELHTDGYFSHTRNPMYLGTAIGLLGIAITTGLLINLIFPLLFILIINFTIIKEEEFSLTKTFGDDYSNYKKRVRRWI